MASATITSAHDPGSSEASTAIANPAYPSGSSSAVSASIAPVYTSGPPATMLATSCPHLLYMVCLPLHIQHHASLMDVPNFSALPAGLLGYPLSIIQILPPGLVGSS